MLPDDQPTMPARPPDPSRSSPPGVWVAPSVEDLQAKLPQYEMLEILGRGGMGAVYKARQKSLKRLVAIKILPLGMADDEFKFVERFQNEAQTMAQMNHPAIVSVYDFGETSDGLLYFVMEFVDGTDVHRMIQASGRLSGEYALSITAHVCDALSYAHKRGVIHRDIKPANILIDQEGHIKVADFGLAKMDDPSQTSGLTKTNMAMGTPDYVAPEVLTTGMVADHRADIYAVGVMLYQMLTGEVPRGMFKLPSQKGIGSDERFDAIICKAMEQDREERYQSAMDVRRDLDVILTTPQPKNDGTGIVAEKDIPQKPVAKQPRPPGNADTPVRTSSPPAQRSQANSAADKSVRSTGVPPKKQSPATMWLSIGGIIAVLAAAGILVLGGKSKPQAESKSGDVANTPLSGTKSAATTKTGADAFEKWTDRMISTKWSNTWSLKDGVLVPVQRLAVQDLTEGGDVALRIKARRASNASEGKTMVQPSLRQGKVKDNPKRLGSYQFQGYVPGDNCSLVYIEEDLGTRANPSVPEYLFREQKLPPDLLGKAEIEWEFRAIGDELSVLADGQKVASVHDSRILTGKVRVMASPGVEITGLQTSSDLIGTRKADAAASPVSDKPAGPVIDWIKALPPEAPPWSAEWGDPKDGVLTSSSKVGRQFGFMRDGTVRMRVRLAPNQTVADKFGPMIQLDIRNGGVAGGDGATAQYQFQIYVPNRDCNLVYIERAANGSKVPGTNLWTGERKERSDAGNAEVEWEFRAQGDELSAWADGQLVHSLRDARVAAGLCTLGVPAGVQVTRLETTGLIPTKPSPSNPTVGGSNGAALAPPAGNSSPEPPVTSWLDVTPTIRDYAKTKPGVVMEDDLIVWTGDNRNPPHLTVTPAGQNDYAIRLRHVGAGQINLRSNEKKGFIYVQSASSGVRINRWMKGVAAPVTLLVAKDIPFSYDKGEPHDLTVTIQGSTISAWLDGLFMGKVDDTLFAEGTGAVALMSSGKVQKVEIAEVKDEAASAKAAPPPAVTSWQDVTNILRDSVRTKTGFTVDSAGVHRASGAPIGDTMVMKAGEKDRAVRVRYVGQTQVSLWIKSGDSSAYVLAARDRVMIKRQLQKSGEAESMLPSVVHPVGFDPAQPHELIVTVRGAAVGVWLDGRHIGEVEDTALKDCSIAIVPMASSTVQKVEVAELNGAAAKGDWQPIFMKPEDFGGDLRDVEFRDGAVFIMKRSHLAPASITAIRATLRFCASDRTGSLSLRSAEGAAYGEEDFACMAYVAPSGIMVMKVRDRTTGSPELKRQDHPLSPALKLEESFTFELRATDGKITASINGHEVSSVPDTWKGGARRFSITPSTTEMTEFRDVAVLKSAR